MIYSNDTYDITSNISTYLRRDFKSVYDTTAQKWYMLNNLGTYEEYGIYGTDFSTHYVGKLVIVNDEEYEWDGTEWDDLGPYINIITSVYRDGSHLGYITFTLNTTLVRSVELTFKMTGAEGSSFILGCGSSDSSDWRLFAVSNSIYYDCANGRYSGSRLNTKYHWRLGANCKIYDYDSQQYVWNSSGSAPTGGEIWFGYVGVGNRKKTKDYGYLYDLKFYSDYDGQNLVAQFSPKIVNGVVGIYDETNNNFLTPTDGTLGAEYEQIIPKEYAAKSAPTITTVFASRLFRNGNHYTKLMRNDDLQEINYMSEVLSKKVDFIAEPYNTKAYLSLSSGDNYSSSPRFTTSVYLKNTYTLEFKLKTPSSISGWRQVIGTYESSYGANEFAMYTNTNGQYFCMNWWNYGALHLNNDTAFAMVGNTEYVFEIQVGTGVTKINGITQSASGGNNVSATLLKPLGICGIYSGDPGWSGKLYYVKITEGDNLIAYFEANNDNNVPGFLERVSGVKYTNQGSGTVTYGEDS